MISAKRIKIKQKRRKEGEMQANHPKWKVNRRLLCKSIARRFNSSASGSLALASGEAERFDCLDARRFSLFFFVTLHFTVEAEVDEADDEPVAEGVPAAL